MNQLAFAVRNISDKLLKISRSPETLQFYWQNYVVSRFDAVDPDTYIVSYPKCGRTWLRVLLQRYLELCGRPLEHFHDKSLLGVSRERVVKFEHDQGTWIPAPPRIDQLAFRADKYRNKSVLFMVRDPRDVLVSSWYHLKYRERVYQHDLSAFIRDDLVGIRKVVAFTNMWIENSHIPTSFLWLSYEQMHANTASCFQQALEFLGFDVVSTALRTAVEESSFENMKRMELTGSLKEPWMKPGAAGLDKSMKVRRGRVGSARKELSEADVAFLNEVIRTDLTPELSQYR